LVCERAIRGQLRFGAKFLRGKGGSPNCPSLEERGSLGTPSPFGGKGAREGGKCLPSKNKTGPSVLLLHVLHILQHLKLFRARHCAEYPPWPSHIEAGLKKMCLENVSLRKAQLGGEKTCNMCLCGLLSDIHKTICPSKSHIYCLPEIKGFSVGLHIRCSLKHCSGMCSKTFPHKKMKAPVTAVGIVCGFFGGIPNDGCLIQYAFSSALFFTRFGGC